MPLSEERKAKDAAIVAPDFHTKDTGYGQEAIKRGPPQKGAVRKAAYTGSIR